MSLKRCVQSYAVWALLLAVAFLGMVAVAGATDGPDGKGGAAESLLAQAQAQGTVRVIVGLQASFTLKGQHPEGQLPSLDDVLRQQQAVAQAQDALLSRLGAFHVSNVQRLQNVPYLVLEVDAEALSYLLAAPDVTSIEPDEPQPPDLQDSVPLIGGAHAWEMGYTGAGWLVAILDTGVAPTHPFLQGKVVAEGCFSTNSNTARSLCPNGQAEQYGPGAGINCPAEVDGCAHGTHVAGIAAGHHPDDDDDQDDDGPPGGVARGANIVAVQVFSRFDRAVDCKDRPAPCALSYSSDQLRGLDYVYRLATEFRQPIAAVNISIGGANKYTSRCDDQRPAQAEVIRMLRSIGIATVASSGNSGYTDGIGMPACFSSVVSVGATTKSDSVAPFSNSAPFLSLLAPGVNIRSSVPGGDYAAWQGTSMAAPHVTGAWALLKQKKPNATVPEILSILTETGVLITDGRNNVVKPRIRVDAALERLGATPTPTDTPNVTPTPTPTQAVPLPIEEVVAVTAAQGRQENPAATFDPQGNEFLVIWADVRGSTGAWRIFGQRLSPQAALVGGNFLVAETGTTIQDDHPPPYPQVVWNGVNGQYLVAWRSADVGGIVYGQRLTAAGELVAGRVALSPTDIDTTYQHQRLALAYNPDDNEYLVAWADESAQGQVMMRRFNPQLQPLGEMTPVCPVCGSLSQRNPSIVYNSNAHEYFMAWQQLTGASIDIIGQRVTRTATTLTPGIPIAVADGLQNLPDVAYHPLTNQYVVIWRDARKDPSSTARRETWGRLLSADGLLLGEAQALSSTFSDQRNPAVEWHGGDSNGYLVLWADTRAYGGTESSDDTDLMARRLDAAGRPDQPFPHDFLVSRNDDANNPALVYAAPWARYLLVWQDARYDTGPTPLGFDIFAAVYITGPMPPPTFTPTATPTGTPPPPATLTPTPTLTPTATATHVTSGVIVLQQGLDGYAGVRDGYLDRYRPDEPLGQRINLYFYINHGDGQARSILLDFDLDGLSLPPASEIVAAYLQLYQHTFDGDGRFVIRAYDLNRPWDERQASWRRPSADVLWDVPGANGVPGDRKGRGSDPVILSAEQDNGWKQWDVTNIVRWWMGNPNAHFGIKLQAAGETESEVFAYFYAKEDWEHPTLRPRLVIHYATEPNTTTPTPTVTPTSLFPPITMRLGVAPLLVNGGQPAVNATPHP